MVRPRVLLDVDGVLADFLTPCLAILNEEMGWSKTIDDIKHWHVFRSLDVPDEVETRIYEKMKEPGWCLGLKPIEGAYDGVKRLREFGDVFFVTSPMRGPHWVHDRTVWLIQHFQAQYDHVVHCNAKHLVAGDVFIDDRVSHLERWRRSYPNGFPIKFEAGHNRMDEWVGDVMTSWAELPEFKM